MAYALMLLTDILVHALPDGPELHVPLTSMNACQIRARMEAHAQMVCLDGHVLVHLAILVSSKFFFMNFLFFC